MSNITQMSNFEIETITEPTITHTLIFRRSLDENIINYLKQLLDDEEELYNDPIRLSPDILYSHIKTIQNRIETTEDYTLLELSDWLRTYFNDKIEQLERMTQDGKINFNNLESILPIGTKCIGKVLDQTVGFIVSNNQRGVDHFGNPFFKLIGRLTYSNGDKFKQFDKSFIIPYFVGALNVEQLPVRPINNQELEFLTERGKKFIKYGLSSTYASYKGKMFVQSLYGPVPFQADGRIMVDPTGFRKNMPNYSSPGTYGKTVECESIPDDLLFMCYPFVNGFSFTTKQWGEIYVENITDNVYDDNAFDYLVLNPSIKSMIKSLICNSEGVFTDIIQKKSGGVIFALAGTPGCGKTLTAEAISELLHRPLYSITIGELGTTPELLELKLAEILEIAYAWKAIILLDEADTFMEKRTTNDLHKNALVSIFLRLLERFQGIMFLTTNRIEEFDPAFKSRISVRIQFKDLDKHSRYQVWTNLLKASNVMLSIEDIQELSKTVMNGREIKNCIRMSQCMANDIQQPVSKEIIKEVLPFVI